MIRAGCWDCGPQRDGPDFLTSRTSGWLSWRALPKLGVTHNSNTNVQKKLSRLTSQASCTAIFALWVCSLTLAATAPNPDSKPEKTGNLDWKDFSSHSKRSSPNRAHGRWEYASPPGNAICSPGKSANGD